MNKNDAITFVLRALIVVVGIIIICLLLTPKNEEKEVITLVKNDTVVIHDTIVRKIKEVKYKEIRIIDTVYLTSNSIPLQIEQKHYSDSIADIYISGFEPNIDSINYHIPLNTVYIDKVVEIERERKVKWYEDRFVITAGVSAGYGLVHKQPDVYVGVGVGIKLY